MVSILKVCPECGEEFEPHKRRPDQKFCSKVCRGRNGNRRAQLDPVFRAEQSQYKRKCYREQTLEERTASLAKRRDNHRKQLEALKQDPERYREYKSRHCLKVLLFYEKQTLEQREERLRQGREYGALKRADPEYREKHRLTRQKYAAKKRLAELNKTLTALEVNDGRHS